MRHYELSYLISPTLSREEAEELVENITTHIQDEGLLDFTPESQKKPERISLAYPIEEQNNGFLSTLHFFLKPEKVKKIKDYLKEEEEILRFLVFKKEASKKKPGKKKKKEKKKTEKESSSKEKEKDSSTPTDQKKEDKKQNKKRKKVDLDEVEKKLDQILE